MGRTLSDLQFSHPAYLFALALLPLVVYTAYRGLTDFARWQRRLSAVARATVAVLVILALAGLTWVREADRTYVVFVVDRSRSVGPEGRRAADEFVTAALRSRGDAGVGFVDFAAAPGPLRAEWGEPGGEADGRGTDLAAALRAARLAVPTGYTPHLVLLTVGNETAGDVRAAAAGLGVRVSTVPLPARSEPDVQVSAVEVPDRVRPGETFTVKVVVDANHMDRGRIRLLGDVADVDREIDVRPGANVFEFRLKLPADFAGRRLTYTAIGDAFDRDTVRDNNVAVGLAEAAGKPRVLLVEPPGPGGTSPGPAYRELGGTLDRSGYSVSPTTTPRLPDTLIDLLRYDLVILANVPVVSDQPEHALSGPQMDALKAYVRDAGGGLLVIGGDQAFAPGGYHRSRLEEILPVTSDYEKKEKPGLSLVLVLDKSGSMEGEPLQLAKEAAVRAIDALGPKDQAGVIAFNDGLQTVVELSAASDKARAVALVRGIEANGQTVMYPALKQAFDTLSKSGTKRRHVILLTDGESEQADFASLVRQMAAANITVSTVGIGGDPSSAYQLRLKELAGPTLGRGRYYYAGSAASVPQIFARETEKASEGAIQDGRLHQPTVRLPLLPPLKGFVSSAPGAGSVIPGVDKYLLTRPRPTTQIGLAVGDTNDPLLAAWQPGLGTVAVFTSGFPAGWPGGWGEGWEQNSKFWSQVARYLLRKEFPGLSVRVEHRDGRGLVTIDVSDLHGRTVNEAALDVRVVAPDQTTRQTAVRQVAPGRYRTEFDAPPGRDPTRGVYSVIISQNAPDGTALQWANASLAVGYPEELRLRPTNKDLLQAMADETGGAFDPEPRGVFATPQRSDRYPVLLWPYLVIAAAVAFVLDIALRRIDLSGATLLRPGGWSRGREREDGTNPTALATPERAPVKPGVPE